MQGKLIQRWADLWETVLSGGDLINDLNLNGIADSGEPVVSFPTLLNIHLIFQVRGAMMQFQLDFDQLGVAKNWVLIRLK